MQRVPRSSFVFPQPYDDIPQVGLPRALRSPERMRHLRVVHSAPKVRCGPLLVALYVVPPRPARVRVRAVQRHIASTDHIFLWSPFFLLHHERTVFFSFRFFFSFCFFSFLFFSFIKIFEDSRNLGPVV
jgi:hypothetical protein